ncbi:PQQ-binding-like beta-propeller repeat protein [Cellulomonas sp. McL0617]|uniref:outer membrane protein assembly factor BamB family protein n=1 Tax=Cellulomonas sp. McL0617 TaxID=3415675 RepID=UPI003CF2EA40
MSESLRGAGHRQILVLEDSEPVRSTDTADAVRDWMRRHAAWLVVVAVLAVLVLVGAQRMVDARERQRLAYLARVPGILQPVPAHVAALWRWAPTDPVTVVADDTAGRWTIGTRYGRGVVDLRGTDPDTGAVRWTTPFPIDDALPPADRGTFPSVWVRCATAAAAPHARAVCGADLAGPGQVVGTPLMVLDPTNGAVLARQILPAGTLWTVSAGHLVIATPVADDRARTHWDVTVTDPSTGAAVWHTRTPTVPVSGPVRVGVTTIDPAATLSADPQRVLLAGDGHAWVWSPSGATRASVSVGVDGTTALGRAGTLVWTPFQSLTDPAGELVTDQGTHVTVDGTQVQLSVDDGTAHGVVLLRTGAGGTTIVADDASTGRELWRADGSTGPVLVLDGAVVATGSSSVVSRDARTGALRWRTQVGARPVYLGADPLHIVVLTDDLQLQALDLADGRTAVRADAASLLGKRSDEGVGGLDGAQEHGGRLLLTFRDGSGGALG